MLLLFTKISEKLNKIGTLSMKNMMKYKGYLGSVEYSEEDNCLFGKIQGIRSLVTFEGQSVKELKQAFQCMVDDYIETCKEVGIEPEKPDYPLKELPGKRLEIDSEGRINLKDILWSEHIVAFEANLSSNGTITLQPVIDSSIHPSVQKLFNKIC